MTTFQKDILQGIPKVLPQAYHYDVSVNHAPKRKDWLYEMHFVILIPHFMQS